MHRFTAIALAATLAVIQLCSICPSAEAAAPNLSVLYETPAPQSTADQAEPWFEIVNNGTAPVSLADLTIRYWFTADNAGVAQQFNCDWAQVACANVSGSFITLANPAAKANTYMQVSFSAAAGSISADGNSGAIETRFNDVGWLNFNQANDYSFNAAATSFVPSSTITLYYNGALVWGVEPTGAAAPTPTVTTTPTTTATATPTSTRTATRTPTPKPTRTPKPTKTATITATPTVTPSAKPTATPTAASPTPTPTATASPGLSSGTINFHFYYGVSPETPEDSLTLNGDNYTDLIMSNMIAGVMYGHLIQEFTPGMQFDKDYLYGSLIGQLLQENIATEFYQSGSDLIDPSPDQVAVMGEGQGGPYQINNYAVDLVAGTYAPAGFSLINYAAIQKNLGFTMADAATQYTQPTPASFNNKYYGPMLPAYFHFNDYKALQYIGGNTLTQPWTPTSSDWTPQWQPYYYDALGVFEGLPGNFLDIVLNVAYNQGYYGSLFLSECKLASTATEATIATANSYSNAWGGDTYQQYPYQVHNYLDQMYDNPTPSPSNLSVTLTYDNHIIFNLNSLSNVFSNVFQTLAYTDNSGNYNYIPATEAIAAFNTALASTDLTLATNLDLSSSTDRAKIFTLLETAITDLETSLNTNFSTTTQNQL